MMKGVTPEDIDGSAKDSTTVTKEDIDSAADAINNRKSGGNSNTGSNGVDPENKGTDSGNTDNEVQDEQNENDSSNGLFNAIMDIVEGGETHNGEKFSEGITNTITEVANGVAQIIGLEP